uniref:calcineurin-binding protein cabin-1-like n=1 Tax=Styela clava TaxID=7725 RepID=UPI0019394064|nr:calcineurin-binding protein cabin-1-like [Styela clava]
MFKLSALNERKSEDVTEVEKPLKDTREAQEAQAFKLYNEALCLQQNNQHDEAVSVYEKLLQTPLIIESATTLVNEDKEAIEHPLKDPGLILKYSTHKNVANICAGKGDTNRAMENYLQAVMLDTSDVTLWYKIGVLAAKLSNLHLSRRALTQGLQCNPNHWPCLDSVITVCYAILDYENCLMWISKALKKDPCYKKGIYFRRKMISECPHLKRDFDHLFQDCGHQVFENKISESDAKGLLSEALTLRENNRKLCIRPPPPIVPLSLPLKSASWLNLGKSLIATYNYIESQDEPITLSCKIDLNVFKNNKAHEENGIDDKSKDSKSKVASKSVDTTLSSDLQNSVSVTAINNSKPNDEVSKTERFDVQSVAATDLTSSCTNFAPDSDTQNSEITQSSTTLTSYVGNSQKKSTKRKRAQDKFTDQERQSKRRSSRMKKSAFSKSESECENSIELDFRQSLLHLLPKSLLPPKTQNLSIDLDSDTNSQDSTFMTENNNSGITTATNTKLNESPPNAQTQTFSTDINVSVKNNLRTQSNEATPECMEVKESNIQAPMESGPAFQNDQISENVAQLKNLDKLSSKADDKLEIDNNTEKKQFECKAEMNINMDLGQKLDSSDAAVNKVKLFIDKYNETNYGILHIMHEYCKCVARTTHMQWENGLADVFLSVYEIVQPTIHMESFDNMEINIQEKILYSYNMITHLECVLDKAYKKNSVDFNFIPSSLEYGDMRFIIDASYRPQVLEEDSMLKQYCYKYFVLRYHWVRATYFFLMGYKDSTSRELTMCSKMCIADTEVTLHHLKHHNKINSSLIRQRLDSLKRFQVLEKVEQLHTMKKYDEIVKIILPKLDELDLNFDETKMQEGRDNDDMIDRPKLLKYLIDSALALNDSKTSGKSFIFVLSEATESISDSEKSGKDWTKNKRTSLWKEWYSLIILCCGHFNDLFQKGIGSKVLNEMDKNLIAELSKSLLSVVHFGMLELLAKQSSFLQSSLLGSSKSQASSKNFAPKDSLMPWILLFHVLRFEEQKQLMPASSDDFEDITGSYKLLMTAHGWLGDKSLCCADGGVFLRFLLKNFLKILKNLKEKETVVDILGPMELSNDSKRSLMPSADHKQTIKFEIEQCFFCLYGFPNKILKSSMLIDHASQQSVLTWAGAVEMLEYFRPAVLPGFDSYKANTMLGETASLVMRIIKLIPQKLSNKVDNSLKILEDSIGKICDLKNLKIPDIESVDLEAIKDIYYLLADYYFKNKEMTQAARYYQLDLCLNAERFDSWAGLALAKSSIIDEKLRLCVAKSSTNELAIIELSKFPLMCYEKAMSIEKSSTTLWIEYGSLAYWIHSFCSRQIRRKSNISDDSVSSLTFERNSMLDLAQRCFEHALKCDAEDINNEEWLIQYMLGKVAEKKQESIQNYLLKYSKAAGLLHRKHAKYPKKIQFKSYQSDYAIEALEMHYRLHTSILKLVQREINVLDGFEQKKEMLKESDYDLFDDLLEESSVSQFVRRDVLPYSQLETDNQMRKHVPPAKLVTQTPQIQSSSLTMGSLVPDAIATALSFQLSADSSQSIPSAIDELSMDIDISPDSNSLPSPTISPTNVKDNDGNGKSEAAQLKKTTQENAFTNEARMIRALVVMAGCVSGLHICLGRLPQHYKSLHRLAYLFMHCSKDRRHANWSRDILLGSETPWQQLAYMPSQGLLSERNKTNLFNGVWKIPVDEIDRPGSFGSHLYRCVLLLLNVFLELGDHNKLFYMHNMLNRNPDQGRKYLRDADRICASQKALTFSIKALQKKVLSNVPTTPKSASQEDKNRLLQNVISSSHFKSSEALSHLLDASKLYLQKQRIGSPYESSSKLYDVTEPHKELLITAFQKYTLACPQAIALFPNVDVLSTSAGLERIVKFCQQYAGMPKVATGGNTSMPTPTKSDSKFTSATTKKVEKIGDQACNDNTDKNIQSKDTSSEDQTTEMGIKDVTFDRKKLDKSNDKSQVFQEIPTGTALKILSKSGYSSDSQAIVSNETESCAIGNLKDLDSTEERTKFNSDVREIEKTSLGFSVSNKAADASTLKQSAPQESMQSSVIDNPNPLSLETANKEEQYRTYTTVTTIIEGVITANKEKLGVVDEKTCPSKPMISGNILSETEQSYTRLHDNPNSVQASKLDVTSVIDDTKSVISKEAENNTSTSSSISSQSDTCTTSKTVTKSGVTLVKKGSQVYTKIMPSRPFSGISHSPRSAFTPAKHRITPEPGKSSILKRSPQMDRLAALSHSNPKAPLLRSTSMPVSIEDDKTSQIRPHKTLLRTGSISDYTKQKLKSSILMRTSASLVRKPSITEHEIEQILTDPESSQSEDDDEIERNFKPLGSPSTSAYTSIDVINRPVAVTPVLSTNKDVPVSTSTIT